MSDIKEGYVVGFASAMCYYTFALAIVDYFHFGMKDGWTAELSFAFGGLALTLLFAYINCKDKRKCLQGRKSK